MRNFFEFVARCLCAGSAFVGMPAAASASSTRVIYNFTGGADGAFPFSTLTPDAQGNLYGTTQEGGAQAYPSGYGTIYKLDPSGALTTLYDFEGGALGGRTEAGVSLIRGLLYGGALGGPNGATGVLFSIGTDGSNYSVLHAMSKADGEMLIGLLQPFSQGGEFGLGAHGGRYGHGTVFLLAADNSFSVIHAFAGGSDGSLPTYLVEDGAGNLYGSTSEGGVCATTKLGCGVIFKYAPSTREYSILYTFTGGQDGGSPLLGAVGPDGTLYGVTTTGGADNHGALFSLTPNGGSYGFSVLSPIISRYHSDYSANPPSLSPTGALLGETVNAGYYVYQNGTYTIQFNKLAVTQSQFLIPATQPDVFYGTSYGGGGSSACAYGCGIIYYGKQ